MKYCYIKVHTLFTPAWGHRTYEILTYKEQVQNDIAYNVIKILNFGSGIHKSLKSLHQLLSRKKTFTQLTLRIGLPFMFLYGKDVIIDYILLLFNRIYLILEWGRIARKCLKMSFLTSKAKFELP